jgi:hypothetical protein
MGEMRAVRFPRRVDRVIVRVQSMEGSVALFAHGHLFRVFAGPPARLFAIGGLPFLLDTATVSVMSYYQGIPAIKRWKAPARPEALLPDDAVPSQPARVGDEQR